METFDHLSPAELFVRGAGASARRGLAYYRFTTGGEAIRFAVERLSADLFPGAVIEVDEKRFESADIRTLYAQAGSHTQLG